MNYKDDPEYQRLKKYHYDVCLKSPLYHKDKMPSGLMEYEGSPYPEGRPITIGGKMYYHTDVFRCKVCGIRVLVLHSSIESMSRSYIILKSVADTAEALDREEK